MSSEPDTLRRNRLIRIGELEALHEAGFRWALSQSGGRSDDACDALQRAYLAIIEGHARFRGDASLKTFLFAVIRRCAAKQNASRSREAGRVEIEDVTNEVERDVDAWWIGRRVRHHLRALSTMQRSTVELVFYHGLSVGQAARVLGVSSGAARQHYHRAKRRLEKALEDVFVGIADRERHRSIDRASAPPGARRRDRASF